jgi:hypothetical protein
VSLAAPNPTFASAMTVLLLEWQAPSASPSA